MPTFKQVYELLMESGQGKAISRKGTQYRVEANHGRIVAFPKSGRVTVHEDCWMNDKTCQGTWASGIYNGPYSIIDWYNDKMRE